MDAVGDLGSAAKGLAIGLEVAGSGMVRLAAVFSFTYHPVDAVTRQGQHTPVVGEPELCRLSSLPLCCIHSLSSLVDVVPTMPLIQSLLPGLGTKAEQLLSLM